MLYMGKALNHVADFSPMLGCDPEFFFKKDGEIIGAEKFLPKAGLDTGAGKVIIDGVQAELNPAPSYCREILSSTLKTCFRQLQASLQQRGAGISCDFSRTIEISKENLMELAEESRKFGCAPSYNTEKDKTGLKISKIDPTEYRVRAAGGHIHLGHNGNSSAILACTKRAEQTVELLDIICGNTCVLIDRDTGNIERRKVYGKAGEYRLPKHGLEYRTLSNFWLISYPVMSLVFGLARLAFVMSMDTNYKEIHNEFTSKVKSKNIRDAINNNDFDLAMENFQAIERSLMDVTVPGVGRYPINGMCIAEFYHFAYMIQQHGMQYWFKEDPMAYWTKSTNDHTNYGFYDFAVRTVRQDMIKSSGANETVTKIAL